MTTPQFGVSTILPKGNSDYGTNGGPPQIDNRVFMGGFGGILPAPGQRFPRVPLIERITPKNINAERVIGVNTARARAMIVRRRERVMTTVTSYVNAARMKRR